MALIKCIECGSEVSEYASACPKCGCPTTVIKQHILKDDSSNELSDKFFEELFKYEIIGKNVKIIGIKNEEIQDVAIPKYYKNNKITSIGDYAFYNCLSLESITIPDSVTSIGHDAFSGCSYLESISIPDSVTSIGNYAFNKCSSLTYNKYDNALYLGNDTNPYLILIKAEWSIKKCDINKNTKLIYYDAFRFQSSLESITIPRNVTTLGYGSFYNCSSLTSITIPNNVKIIGDQAFSDCSSLKTVIISKGVTSIGNGVFGGCSSLESIIIPNGVKTIKSTTFARCSSLTSITIPDSVEKIESCAFNHCNSLKSITYSGIKSGWNSISKDDEWDVNTCSYMIHCTDGEIIK